MGVIGLFFFFIIACIASIVSPTEDGHSSTDYTYPQYNRRRYNTGRSRTKTHSRFEPSDSFYDKDGNEHEIDEDGYCEDCDDYHD